MSQWPESLSALIEQGKPLVLITIVDAKGSVPRGAGTKMIVTEQGLHHGTIGGGNLEYQCIEAAKQRLRARGDGWLRKVERFPLGASLGQCCGGMVVVLFENIEAVESKQPEWLAQLLEHKAARATVELITPLNDPVKPKLVIAHQTLKSQAQAVVKAFPSSDQQVAIQNKECLVEIIAPNDFNIVVFGAGHVGRALVHVLSGLECEVTWVDSRADEFPESIPDNVMKVVDPNPEDTVETVPANSYFVVLTHSHNLDQLLCEQIVRRGDFRFCGLIGSKSKRSKFEHRMRAKGFSEQQIASLTCPIGISSLSGKQPGHIAIAVAAQLLAIHEAVLMS